MKRTLIPIAVALVLATPVLAQQMAPAATDPKAGTISDLATGADLKGPPKLFVGSDTPE